MLFNPSNCRFPGNNWRSNFPFKTIPVVFALAGDIFEVGLGKSTTLWGEAQLALASTSQGGQSQDVVSTERYQPEVYLLKSCCLLSWRMHFCSRLWQARSCWTTLRQVVAQKGYDSRVWANLRREREMRTPYCNSVLKVTESVHEAHFFGKLAAIRIGGMMYCY